MKLYKTELGQAAFRQRSPLLSARQRPLFLLCDGNKSAEELLAATAGMGLGPDDLAHLLAQGFLEYRTTGLAPLAADLPEISGFGGLMTNRSDQQRYMDAKPIATRLTASLGLRGFRLNLAVEAAAGHAELLQLLPRIQAAVGVEACIPLERALRD